MSSGNTGPLHCVCQCGSRSGSRRFGRRGACLRSRFERWSSLRLRCDLRARQRETARAALQQALEIYEQIQHPQARQVADTLREMSDGAEESGT